MLFDKLAFRKRFRETFDAVKHDNDAKYFIEKIEKDAIEYVDIVLNMERFKEIHKHDMDRDLREQLCELDKSRRIKHEALKTSIGIFKRYVTEHKEKFPKYPEHDLFFGYSIDNRNAIGDWAFEFVRSFYPKNIKEAEKAEEIVRNK